MNYLVTKGTKYQVLSYAPDGWLIKAQTADNLVMLEDVEKELRDLGYKCCRQYLFTNKKTMTYRLSCVHNKSADEVCQHIGNETTQAGYIAIFKQVSAVIKNGYVLETSTLADAIKAYKLEPTVENLAILENVYTNVFGAQQWADALNFARNFSEEKYF